METQTQTDVLFTQYLNVVNQALDRNRDKVPYKQILDAAGKVLNGKLIGYGIYKSDPGQPFDHYTVRYRDGKMELVEHGKRNDTDFDVKLGHEYVNRVANDPETYIERPEKLDLDWLKSRLGL